MTNKLLKVIFLVCSGISFQVSNAQYLRTDGTNSMTNTLNINVPSSYSSVELRSNIGSFIDFHSSVSSDFDGRIIWNHNNSNRFDIYGETNFNNPTKFNNKVGIYTSMPNALLDVHTEANTPAIYNSQSWSTSHAGYGLELLTEWNDHGISQRFVQQFSDVDYNSLSFFKGRIGIGTSLPAATLEIFSETSSPGIYNSQFWSTTNPGYSLRLLTEWNNEGINQRFVQRFNGFDHTVIGFFKGNVLIGKAAQSNTSYKLDVEGKIRANEIVVNTSGADYVFESGYDLRTLQEVQDFIDEKGHLPGIPSAKEMQAKGMAMGELNTKLLEKIEELTLYIIEQNSKIESLEEKLKKL